MIGRFWAPKSVQDRQQIVPGRASPGSNTNITPPSSNMNISTPGANTNITPPSSNAPEFQYEYLDPGFEYENHTPEFEYEYLDPGFDYEYHAPEFEHRDSRSQFVAISEPKLGNNPRKPPQAHFVAISESKLGMAPECLHRPIFMPFPSPSQEMAPGSLQRRSFTHFRARPRKWSQEAWRGSFLTISEPKAGNGPRKPAKAQVYLLIIS